MTGQDSSRTSSQFQRADALCQILRARPTTQEIDEASLLLPKLRDWREFTRLCDLAELVCRFRLDDAKIRRLYAQGLIETKRLALAVDFLEGALGRIDSSHSEYPELKGLLGRAYKQLLMDTVGPDRSLAQTFLDRSTTAYRSSYQRDPARHFWHGANLSALGRAAAQRGLSSPPKPSPIDYATSVLASLDTIPLSDRDHWWSAAKAEAHVARGEWIDAENALREYIGDSQTSPFSLASTLRQLRELWVIQEAEVGARLLQMLEAALVSRAGGVLTVDPGHLVAMRSLEKVDTEQLQRVVGPNGRETLRWYRCGLERAGAVASVSERLGLRFGTGFAVRGADVGVHPAAEVFLLTNFHVLNRAGLAGRTDFGNVEIVFEAAADVPLTFAPRDIVAQSDDQTGLDYALLRLDGPRDRLKPLRFSRAIARANSKARVYVIGYPLGESIQFSLQDNLLIDHECEPTGRPPDPARRRVHYSAATEKGSSGSPVFDKYWDCIALHHAGGKRDPKNEEYGIPPLNGGPSFVEANEGIWIGSIQDHLAAKKIRLGP